MRERVREREREQKQERMAFFVKRCHKSSVPCLHLMTDQRSPFFFLFYQEMNSHIFFFVFIEGYHSGKVCFPTVFVIKVL